MEQINIEEIRRRAKDNKANNGYFYLKYALDSLDKLRNIFFLATFALIGYLGATKMQFISKTSIRYLVLSIIFGFASYLFLYLFSFGKAKMYSDLEKNLSQSVFPTIEDYNNILRDEQFIYRKYNYLNIWYFLQLITVVIQGILLIFFSISIFYP
ncbi:MAG: hypothetical protein AB7D02_02850 [Candidatus Paceibacterota bacterium]